jgi:catechol 2,3-dioxygenase-like lactoylglutathione lyase family enzyme
MTTTMRPGSGIKGLHHNAYRCRDSEETRKFYEDFLGLPLTTTLRINITKSGRECPHLHTFYKLDDGSFLAFFDAPDMPFDFKEQHDFDLHIALEVTYEHMLAMQKKGKELGMEVRGISDHDFIHSIYFRDPNGYVIELAAPMPNHADRTDPSKNRARAMLDEWERHKAGTAKAG